MGSSFIEVEIQADARLRENLGAILGQIGFEGFWEEGDILRCYISEHRWSPSMLEEVQSTAALVARSSSSAAPRIHIASIPPRNWNAEWEKTIKPIQITERLVITPTWQSYDARPDQIVLTIDPKMSFGTGYHETTRLVLRLMERHLRGGTSLLDVGTGTGILAIAGIRLGARSAVAVDVDEWSYNNAHENAELNGVRDRLEVLLGDTSVVPPGQFEMIVANIQLNVIEPMLGELRSRLASGGLLILSGLLCADGERIDSSLLEHRLKVVERFVEDEWLAVVCDHRIE
jgi:ribosomal protein L11 methyltransferase